MLPAGAKYGLKEISCEGSLEDPLEKHWERYKEMGSSEDPTNLKLVKIISIG